MGKVDKAKQAIAKVLPAFSTVVPEDKVLRCPCGSAVFFDWGIQVITQFSSGQSPRYQDFTNVAGVKICARDQRALVVWDGDLYDASEFVSADEIQSIIQSAQARQHTVPAKVMDP